ncbi:YceI family protein [Novacetimonas pomaceti]|nr:YceI family protein [Novacetimonas pomaceti]
MTGTNLSLPLAILLCAGVLSPVGGMSAHAQATIAPRDVRAGTYQVDPAHTEAGFSVLHMGFSHYSGMFSNISGTLTLDPRHLPATNLHVIIPIASIQTPSMKLDNELRGSEWFDTARFADATFVSISLRQTGADAATLNGLLSLHGITHPLTLQVRFVGAGTNPMNKKYTVGFDATGTLRRSDYGITAYLPMIGDTVTLRIAGAFERQDQERPDLK